MRTSVAFTDGIRIGATLDRNGLRPSRYYVTKDDLVVMASEVGVLDIPPERILKKGRLQPGRMFLVDTSEGRIIGDEEIKQQIATAAPYGAWLKENLIKLGDLPKPPSVIEPDHETVLAPNYWWIVLNAALAGPALLEQARLREGRGQVPEARRAYSRFLEWYDAPMASQRHLVGEARTALTRLSGVREIPADALPPSAD